MVARLDKIRCINRLTARPFLVRHDGHFQKKKTNPPMFNWCKNQCLIHQKHDGHEVLNPPTFNLGERTAAFVSGPTCSNLKAGQRQGWQGKLQSWLNDMFCGLNELEMSQSKADQNRCNSLNLDRHPLLSQDSGNPKQYILWMYWSVSLAWLPWFWWNKKRL